MNQDWRRIGERKPAGLGRKGKSLFLSACCIAVVGMLYQACNDSTDVPLVMRNALVARAEVKQPIAFDHAAHIKAEDMDCKDCHRFANKTAYATIPKLKDCADCHSEPQGKNPEEAKVRQYLQEGKEIPWVRVNRLPGHVYFSHRAHITFGEMKCWDCHRDMRKVSTPVTEPDINYLTMSKCMECHKQRNAEFECTTCHK